MEMGITLAKMEELTELVDKSVKCMTKRVTGLEMQRLKIPVKLKQETSSLRICTTGDYRAEIILNAEDSLLLEITRNMKHAENTSAEEVPLYTTEYFNILCGYIISHLNNRLHIKSRFGIPQFTSGFYEQCPFPEKSMEMELFFRCPYGAMRLKSISLSMNCVKTEK